MSHVGLTIDGLEIKVAPGTTILEAAKSAGIYIPTLCHHPDLPPAIGSPAAPVIYQGDQRLDNAMPQATGKGCGLCVVEVGGESDLVPSCITEVWSGMAVVTRNERIRARRQENLIPILTRHRHACLTCAQQGGCSLSTCSSSVPEKERCCPQFGRCELQNVVNFVGVSPATPKWMPTDLPILDADPLFVRDPNLCIGCTRCVRACRDLRGIEAIGFVFDPKGEVQVGTLAAGLAESGCRFCTACVEVCPTGALADKSVRSGKRGQDLVPCREACPAGIDVPEYLRWIARGRQEEANAVIRERVPLPGVLGRVCPHPCEDVCRRREVNEAISICALKRYAADRDRGLWKERSLVGVDTGREVAIVGAGPAGLTAAFYLRKQGHAVTLFEAQEQAGGMMRYGIPAYRLPEAILDREIGEILDLGIEFRPNRTLGRGMTLTQLRQDGYDGVFLGVGSPLSRGTAIAGTDPPDVLGGLEFLHRIAQGKEAAVKEKVIVIGGGNVAVDVARTVIRCGARKVIVVCLEGREEMPAHGSEVRGAVQEGVEILPSWGLKSVLSVDGDVKGVELIQCSRVWDNQGNFSPTFADTRRTVGGDQVILATGQAPDLSFLAKTPVSSRRGLIVVHPDTLETGWKGVYAGGDVIDPAGTVIQAIAAGRKAAASMDRALGGSGDIEERLFQRERPGPRLGKEEGFARRARETVPERDPVERVRDFHEVVLGFGDAQAAQEAGRCLQCDLRLSMESNPGPPPRWVLLNRENVLQVPEREGVYHLLDEHQKVLVIKGTADLRRELMGELTQSAQARWFWYEEDKMYSQRESEQLQHYLREHGKMPGGDSDLDDLL